MDSMARQLDERGRTSWCQLFGVETSACADIYEDDRSGRLPGKSTYYYTFCSIDALVRC